uniref:Cyclic nucleotide-binding domain-containing protein n=1 Tax=Ditylenchus dipsaci TaxID=166011 RepID=A0A915CZG3_9BILA
MYIIKKGEVEVMEEQTFVQSITILSDGSCFGELSILNLPGKFTDNRRTQTVRTKGFVDLYVLDKKDLNRILQDFPDAKKAYLKRLVNFDTTVV